MTERSTTERMNRAAEPYKVVVMRSMNTAHEVFWHADVTEALATAVEYMRRGYWVRLSDFTVAQFEAEHHMVRLRDRLRGQERP